MFVQHWRYVLQAEYERVKAAYTDMSANLESLSAEKRRLVAAVAQMEADGRRGDRERRSLEQQVLGWGVWAREGLWEAWCCPERRGKGGGGTRCRVNAQTLEWKHGPGFF